MRRIFFLLTLLFALITPSFAQRVDEFSGTLTVAFGRVRQADGSYRDIKGLRLPFHAVRIHASIIKKGTKGGVTLPPPGGEDSTTVYNADAGAGYGMLEEPDPSSLDDLNLQGGAGLPWENLTFGMDIADSHDFIIRWIVFDTYVEGRGPGAPAFEPQGIPSDQGIADFGVLWPAGATGTFKVTIAVGAAGVTVPNNSIFMAQQFREPDPPLWQGLGALDQDIRNVYNPAAQPTTGSSDNVFWFDWDPQNGFYAEDEIDNFGEGTFANHLRTITTSGTQDTLVPFQFNLAQGTFVSGELIDFWQSDNTYYRARALYNVPRTTPPLQIEVEGLSPVATITSMKFSLEASGDSPGGSQIISLFNYQTNAYDVVRTDPITATDSTREIIITNNPSKYVHPSNRRMKAKISYFPPIDASRTWTAKIDRTAWINTRP